MAAPLRMRTPRRGYLPPSWRPRSGAGIMPIGIIPFEKNTDQGELMKPQKIKNLVLRQSCQDAWQEYEKSLTKKYFIQWDYVILTASNEEQAAAYRAQIDARLAAGRLPAGPVYEVLPDPDGKAHLTVMSGCRLRLLMMRHRGLSYRKSVLRRLCSGADTEISNY